MVLGVTLLHLALQAASIVLFPVLALRARREGPGRLWRTTGLGVGMALLFAALGATPWAGNALASTYGYGNIASGAMVLYGLTLGLPMISSSAVVHVFGDRIRSQPGLYVLCVVSAVAAWVAGVVAATRILFAAG